MLTWHSSCLAMAWCAWCMVDQCQFSDEHVPSTKLTLSSDCMPLHLSCMHAALSLRTSNTGTLWHSAPLQHWPLPDILQLHQLDCGANIIVMQLACAPCQCTLHCAI